MKLHILYLTNKCNFKCNYCYEHDIPDRKIISFSEIDQLLNHIVETEPESISTLCLFGGEPFLEFDKIKFIFKRCCEIKKEKGKAIALNITTNGSLLHLYLNDIKKMLLSTDVYVSIDISFDGDYQWRRTSGNKVEENLKLFIKNRIPFGLSYTVTAENADHKIIIKDLIKIIKNYLLPATFDKKRRKIRMNFDRSKIESIIGTHDDESYNNYIFKLKEYLIYLYQKFEIPFCEMVCHLCQNCDTTNFNGINYIIPQKKYITEKTQVKEELFNHW